MTWCLPSKCLSSSGREEIDILQTMHVTCKIVDDWFGLKFYETKVKMVGNRQHLVISHRFLVFHHQFSSVQFSRSVVSDSLWSHKSQHARPPCPSPTPRVHPNPCPLSRWCHPTISSSVIPFSSHLQSFASSGSFRMNRFSASSGQRTGASALPSVLPMNIWMDWLYLLAVQGTLKSLLQHHSSKASISSVLSFVYSPTLISMHDYWKNHSFTMRSFVGKVMSLLLTCSHG